VTVLKPIGLAPGAPEEATGQDARKYSTANPVVQRLLRRWMAALTEEVGALSGVLLDVGVGEGLALERVLQPQPAVPSPGFRAPGTAGSGLSVDAVIGVEYRHGKVADARTRIPSLAPVVGDAGMLPVRDGAAHVVTCIELLEHLVSPGPVQAVGELARVTAPGGRCVVSVPWEPWFRLGNLGRGKNVGRLGNDPEHVQWFTPRRLERALRTRFADVRVRTCFPWIIASCEHPRPEPAV